MKNPTFTLLLGLFLSSLAQAQHTISSTNYQSAAATVEVTSMFGSLPSSGYLPVTVEIKNNTGADRVWSLDFVSTDEDGYAYFGSGNKVNTMESSFQFACGNGEDKVYSVLVPVMTDFPSRRGGYNSALNLQLTTRSSGLEMELDSMRSTSMDQWPSVLMSKSLHVNNGAQLDTHLESKFSGSSGYSSNIEFSGDFDPAILPTDWRAYEGYSSVILTQEEWDDLAPAPRSALLEWVRLGGQLIVCTSSGSADLNALGLGKFPDGERTAARSHGSVTVFPTTAELELEKNELTLLIENLRPQATLSEQIVDDYRGANWGLYMKLRVANLDSTFLILIILAFGILVGPVNLFVFAKAGRRHRLFITTPLIALGTSVLLLAVIMIQDGFGGSGERVQLVEVRADNGEHKAYVKQQQFCRTGIVMNGGFESSADVFVSAVPIEPSRLARVTLDNGGGGSKYREQQGEEGALREGAWFQSRSQLAHYVAAVLPTRGRVAIAGGEGAPMVNSSFDFTIETLLYRDGAGIWWQSPGDVVPGTELALREISEQDAEELAKTGSALLSEGLREDFLSRLLPRKGHFVAFTKDAPGVETHAAISWQQTHSIFTGPVVAE